MSEPTVDDLLENCAPALSDPSEHTPVPVMLERLIEEHNKEK